MFSIRHSIKHVHPIRGHELPRTRAGSSQSPPRGTLAVAGREIPIGALDRPVPPARAPRFTLLSGTIYGFSAGNGLRRGELAGCRDGSDPDIAHITAPTTSGEV